MSLRNRITKLEKFLPAKSKQEKKEFAPIISWLIQNNEDFRECIRKFWRLGLNVEQQNYDWKSWKEPYREQAKLLITRMNQIIEENKGINQEEEG